MNLYKISIKELILILIISMPIGAFLYWNNSNKISIEYKITRGYGYVQNLCNSTLESYKKEILSDEHIQPLMSTYSNNKLKVSVEFPKLSSFYYIKVTGTKDQIDEMKERSVKTRDELNRLEKEIFYKLLGNIDIHCGNDVFKVYKYIAPNNELAQEYIKTKYRKSYLLFLFICPLMVLYLLIISRNYIKKRLS